MSHILLKQVPESSITTPNSTDIKIFSNFNDNGVLYYVDGSGNKAAIGGGSSSTFITTTYNNLYSLYSSGQFVTASYYLISDFYTIYEQPDFYFDGTLKTQVTTKTSPLRPIMVFAVNNNTLAPYATQIAFPKDKLKYDISWNKTEFNHNSRGRITERVDEYNNRTDYDHRAILYRRYQSHIKDTQLTGSITSWNCISGTVSASGASFSSELSVGDIVIIDSKSDIGYNIGLKVASIVNDDTFVSEVDSLYSAGVPSPVTLFNGSSIITPIDYSFTSKSYDIYSTTSTGEFDSYREIYFGQSDDTDFDEYYTFDSGSYNNTLSDFSKYYLSLNNNVLILSNNVFLDSANNNLISGDFFYNTVKSISSDNIIVSKMWANSIGSFKNNQVNSEFYNNLHFEQVTYNNFSNLFMSNVGDGISNFMMNRFNGSITNNYFTSSTHVYGTYSCEIFTNSVGQVKLSYYNAANSLQIVNVTD